MRRVIIMGAAGRDFHDFNTVLRDSDTHRVVAFTATQIPGIDGRVYPASLAGARHPDGIPIRPQEELEQLIADLDVDEVVLSYSDLAYTEVHRATPPGARPARRPGSPPDAVRRPGGDAGPALGHPGGHRRLQPDHRGARGVRGPVRMGLLLYAGVDYGGILEQAAAEAM